MPIIFLHFRAMGPALVPRLNSVLASEEDSFIPWRVVKVLLLELSFVMMGLFAHQELIPPSEYLYSESLKSWLKELGGHKAIPGIPSV